MIHYSRPHVTEEKEKGNKSRNKLSTARNMDDSLQQVACKYNDIPSTQLFGNVQLRWKESNT